MRIFSKFHDYYDTALGYGIDPNITYERKEEDITTLIKKSPDIESKLSKIHDDLFDFNLSRISSNDLRVASKTIILFCGKIYICVKVVYKSKKDDYYNTVEGFVYTFDAFKKVIDEYSKINLDKEIGGNLFIGKPISASKRFKSLFERQATVSDIVTDLHFELDSPIITLDYDLIYYTKKNKVCRDRRLRDIEFYRVVNPFEAFQEISMFIGGIMGGKSPVMISVSDKDRLAKHGFDKFSFRKEKQ